MEIIVVHTKTMKTLHIYSADGFCTDSSCEDIENDVFRKVLNIEDQSHITEMMIAKKLMEQPQPNVVEIYDVVQDDDLFYIDMELLNDTYVPFEKYSIDIRNALCQLHTLGVVYIDIKADNKGFSAIDKTYKLFDFDCSGIINLQDPKDWLHRPFNGFRYSQIKDYEATITSLCDLDFISWELTYKKKW